MDSRIKCRQLQIYDLIKKSMGLQIGPWGDTGVIHVLGKISNFTSTVQLNQLPHSKRAENPAPSYSGNFYQYLPLLVLLIQILSWSSSIQPTGIPPSLDGESESQGDRVVLSHTEACGTGRATWCLKPGIIRISAAQLRLQIPLFKVPQISITAQLGVW